LRRRALRNWRAKIDVGQIYGTKPQDRTDKMIAKNNSIWREKLSSIASGQGP
jgi:hypothetical protein